MCVWVALGCLKAYCCAGIGSERGEAGRENEEMKGRVGGRYRRIDRGKMKRIRILEKVSVNISL